MVYNPETINANTGGERPRKKPVDPKLAQALGKAALNRGKK